MTKSTTLLSVLVAALSATANAGSVNSSSAASRNIFEGSAGISSTTANASWKLIKGGVALSGKSLVASGGAVEAGSVFVVNSVNSTLEDPSGASATSANGVSDVSYFLVKNAAGSVVAVATFAYDGSKTFVQDPDGSIKNAASAVGTAIADSAEFLVMDVSGGAIRASVRAVKFSGRQLKNAYGDDVSLVSRGSGAIASEAYEVSEGATLFLVDSAGDVSRSAAKGVSYVAVKINDSVLVPISDGTASLSSMLEMSGFEDETKDETGTLD